MQINPKNNFEELKSKYDLLEKLNYGVEFLRVYSEYLEIAKELNNEYKIYINENFKPNEEPSEFINTIILLLEKLSKNRDLLILKYNGKSFENDINILCDNFKKLVQNLMRIGFEKQFLYTQDIFNNLLDNIKTTKKGNDFFVETDLPNIFSTLKNIIRLKKEKSYSYNKLNINPLEKMSSFNIYGELNSGFIKNQEVLPTSDGLVFKEVISDALVNLLDNPPHSKDEMMAPIQLIQNKFSIFDVKNKEKKIILQIDEIKKEIALKENSKFKHSFRRTHGINKRFNYLIKINKNPKIKGDLLAEGTTLQNLSNEIKELNSILKNSLKLSDNLIINDNNSGYEINRKYEIKFI